MLRPLFPPTMDILRQNMTLRNQRHGILAANIANAETPGFIAKDLSFEEALRDAAFPTPSAPLVRTHPQHLPIPPPMLQEVTGTLLASPSDDVGRDLNTVSLDREMAKLTTNTFHYNASADMISRSFEKLKRTINERF